MVIPVLSILGLLQCARRCSATTFQIIRDDNTTVIDYEPPEVWKHLPGDCDGCPIPPSNLLLFSNGTWTNGTNIPRARDGDDPSPKGKGSVIIQKDKGKGGDDDDNQDENEGPDEDDPNFVPTPVTITFRFTAASFSLHALVPTFILPGGAPSNTNVSFMLDGISTGPAFTFTPTKAGQEFQDIQVLRLSGLENSQHVIVGSLAPGSTLIVSYVNITTEDTISSQSSSETISNDRLATSISSSPTPSTPVSTSSNSKKNVMTFALAIGLVVGILSMMAFGTFVSLLYRRQKAKKRLALIRAEEEEAEIREFGGRVYGPRPFVPRYFPGTLPPFTAEDEEDNIPPSYDSGEGHTIMISPIPSSPPTPPLLVVLPDILQVREVSNSAPVSIATVTSPPLSLRRSSVISLVAPNYMNIGFTQPDASDPSIQRVEIENITSVPLRRTRSQPNSGIREDETSDCESGGLLSFNRRDHISHLPDTASESGEDH